MPYVNIRVTREGVTDEYFPRVSLLLEQYGAKFLIVDEKPEVIEGAATSNA